MIKLTPVISPVINEFITQQDIIESLTNSFATPLNILFPQQLSHNINMFKHVFKKYHLNAKIYYAHKANKSQALVRQAKHDGVYLDAASEKELHDALISGFTGSEIEVTGPKSPSFLLLSLQHNCLIQVDNLSELEQIVVIHKKTNYKQKIRILIRFSGFSSADTKFATKDSRFGIPIKHAKKTLDFLLAHKDILAFQGFSYHLDSNTPKEKAVALENLIALYELFQEAGVPAAIINMGGGFKTNYIASDKEWNSFIENLKQAALGNIPPITWHNANFGYYKEENRVRGSNNFYEYFNRVAGADYLDEILSVQLPAMQNVTAAQMIGDLMLQLFIEPGRSLLDQTGITVTKVNFVKESSGGEILIGLDMNRSNLASTDQEMMLDPVILYKRRDKTTQQFGVYFIGNLCLESDFIYKHKTFIDQLPQPGDLIIFVNTAAYNMDFTESETIQQRIAKKIAVIKRKNTFMWFEDEIYNPYLLEEKL
jgi:diaminopimelate decarboxylase